MSTPFIHMLTCTVHTRHQKEKFPFLVSWVIQEMIGSVIEKTVTPLLQKFYLASIWDKLPPPTPQAEISWCSLGTVESINWHTERITWFHLCNFRDLVLPDGNRVSAFSVASTAIAAAQWSSTQVRVRWRVFLLKMTFLGVLRIDDCGNVFRDYVLISLFVVLLN